MKTKYNPERRAWRGRSYRNGSRVRDLHVAADAREAVVNDNIEAVLDAARAQAVLHSGGGGLSGTAEHGQLVVQARLGPMPYRREWQYTVGTWASIEVHRGTRAQARAAALAVLERFPPPQPGLR